MENSGVSTGLAIRQANSGRFPVLGVICGTCKTEMYNPGICQFIETSDGVTRAICFECMEKKPTGTIFMTVKITFPGPFERCLPKSDDTLSPEDIEREIRRSALEARRSFGMDGQEKRTREREY